MPSFCDYLRQKTPAFSIVLSDAVSDIPAYIKKQLINAPYLFTTIKGYSYKYVPDRLHHKTDVHFSVTYGSDDPNYMVMQVRNQLELHTAISLMYRFHAAGIKIVVDNQARFIDKTNKYDIIYRAQALVDEELQTSQMSRSSIQSMFWYDGEFVIYTLKNDLFDSAKAVNDMSCYAAALGIRLRAENPEDRQLLEALKTWFQKNVTYQNNDVSADHSAVSLIENKTGVCQAIAAFAFQVLSFCGLMARYVHGEGNGAKGWEAHAWNMVFFDKQWVHIDYTFELSHKTGSIIKPLPAFRKNHRWDEDVYSNPASNLYVQTRRALDHSLILSIPDSPCYAVNGCIIDTSNARPLCITLSASEQAYFSIFDVVTVSGGCYELIDETIHLYFDSMHYTIPFDKLTYHEGSWYCPLSLFASLRIKVDAVGAKIILQNNN